MRDYGLQQDLLTVLLIDDDLVSREVMATVLTMSGYTVHTAAGGEASLKVLAAGGCVPTVILVDAQMPGLSGSQLIDELRAHSRASIYVISASNAPDEMVAAADGFLLKPLTAESLQKLLKVHAPPVAHPETLHSSSAPVPQSGDPAVSPEILAQLREMMPAPAVRQIYAAIVADLDKRIAALEAAIARGDAAEARRIGHAIKGGCGMAGALQASRLGASIESGILESNGNHLDNDSSVMVDLRAATRHLESMLKAGFPA
jgi:CheY-like chemotaxis protein/HPt (histidine-containing phosphotransfer) domain-containing protein